MSMRLSALGCAILPLLCACTPRPQPPAAHAAASTPTTTEAVADLLLHSEYAALESAFDAALQSAVPAEKLKAVWSPLARERGKFLAFEQKHSLRDPSGDTDVYLLRFEHGPVELVVHWSEGRRISGLLIHAGGLRSRALVLAELALRDDADALYRAFSAKMQGALSLERFRAILAQVVDALGPNARSETISVASQGADVVRIGLRGERGAFHLQLAFKRDSGDLEGLLFTPASAKEPDPAPPPYADGARYHEVTLALTAPGRAPLPATLTLPNVSTPVPAVVLVHGSGPQDRDETVGANRPFRDLALGLATRGIAVLRYEKRTFGANVSSLSDAAKITIDEETTDDAVAACQLLLNTQAIDPKRVFVVGHSQGGMLAPRIAAREPRVRGLVLLAAPARPIEDLMLEQQRYLARFEPAALGALPEMEREVARVKAAELARQKPQTIVLGAPVSWWLSLRGYSPVDALVQLGKPSLILQGARDFQVTSSDLALWSAAVSGKPWATVRELPELNHLFESGTGASTPAEYQHPSHVDADVVTAIAEWISATVS